MSNRYQITGSESERERVVGAEREREREREREYADLASSTPNRAKQKQHKQHPTGKRETWYCY